MSWKIALCGTNTGIKACKSTFNATWIKCCPYRGTERLGKRAGGPDLRGCRSVRVTRNFRIVFVICEECRRVPECRFCFCEGLPDETVVFLTIGPHDRAYAMREEEMEYAVAQESTEEGTK